MRLILLRGIYFVNTTRISYNRNIEYIKLRIITYRKVVLNDSLFLYSLLYTS